MRERDVVSTIEHLHRQVDAAAMAKSVSAGSPCERAAADREIERLRAQVKKIGGEVRAAEAIKAAPRGDLWGSAENASSTQGVSALTTVASTPGSNDVAAALRTVLATAARNNGTMRDLGPLARAFVGAVGNQADVRRLIAELQLQARI